jgi:hypothetical protein
MATQALMGTPVRVLQKENGWFLIQTPDRYIAWTESAGIAPLTGLQLDRWKSSERLIYMGDYGLVYQNPENGAPPVSDIVMGGILAIGNGGKKDGNFMNVELPDGRKGFVRTTECLNFRQWAEQSVPDPASMLKTAFSFMGRPYLWGGTSSKGFDCSGFTKTIYMMGGLILSRDASQQVLQGVEVPGADIWNELKTGDLLFFGRKATAESGERVSHVGMYAGGSDFIHCSGLVRVNSLDPARPNFKPYYRTNLLHVKRIIETPGIPASYKSHPWYN